MGKLEIKIGDDVVATHQLRDTHDKRYVLPEHQAEFYRKGRSIHVLGDQFARLGSVAADFEKGLRAEKRSAAGYHMSLILQLAEKVGVPRVAEALRQAARYQAFDAHAVERIVTGRQSRRMRLSATQPSVLPERLSEYLRGAGDFQRSVGAYQKLAPSHDDKPTPQDKEGSDGQRRDGAPDGSVEEAPPATPRTKPR